MSPNTNGFPTADAVGARWSELLRKRYPGPFAAKAIAAALDCNVRTAEAWLAGQAPYLHVALAAAARLRDPALLFELAGVEAPSPALLGRELDDLRADLDALGTRIARLRARP